MVWNLWILHRVGSQDLRWTHGNWNVNRKHCLEELSGARARLNVGFVEDKVNGMYEILTEHFPKNQNVIYYDDFETI